MGFPTFVPETKIGEILKVPYFSGAGVVGGLKLDPQYALMSSFAASKFVCSNTNRSPYTMA